VTIRDVRRGLHVDSLEITHRDGAVLHITVDGFTTDERRRHREELLLWFSTSGIALVEAERGRV